MKAWLTRDTEQQGGMYSLFIKAPPVRDPENSTGCGMWISSDDGLCLTADSDPAAIAEFAIEIAPGECREVEIEMRG